MGKLNWNKVRTSKKLRYATSPAEIRETFRYGYYPRKKTSPLTARAEKAREWNLVLRNREPEQPKLRDNTLKFMVWRDARNKA